MPDVGDRIAVASKGEPRSGVVTAVSGATITVRWDTGGEASLIPEPGVGVVTSRPRAPSARTRPTTSGAAAARKTSASGSRSGAAKKAALGRKAAAGRNPAAKKAVAKKAAPGRKPVAKTPVAKKAAPGKKAAVASRTTGKKTR